MKWIIIVLLSINTHLLFAQVSLKIVKEADNSIYYYPSNSSFTISEDSGAQVAFGTGSVIDFDGNYTIKIKTKWNQNADIITSDTGKLSLSYEKAQKIKPVRATNNWKELMLVEKILMPSQKNMNQFNLATSFSNGLTFTYEDGAVNAYLNAQKLEVKNKHQIVIPEGILKIEFDASKGALAYVLKP